MRIWGMDPVHPSKTAYTNMAVSIIDEIESVTVPPPPPNPGGVQTTVEEAAAAVADAGVAAAGTPVPQALRRPPTLSYTLDDRNNSSKYCEIHCPDL